MNLSPWDYWNEDRAPKAGTGHVLARLTEVMAREPDHAGACHFYIHLVESAWPERAVPCAERLPSLMPGAGHIVHMPAHVYIRVGRYADAIERNQHAVHADEAYIADRHPSGEYPLAYYPHNYHFLAFAAGMSGEADTALDAAWKVAEHTDHTMLHDPDLGGTLQHFITTPVSMLVRFERWAEVLEQPAFDDALTYPGGHWHFARGDGLRRPGPSGRSVRRAAGPARAHRRAGDRRGEHLRAQYGTAGARGCRVDTRRTSGRSAWRSDRRDQPPEAWDRAGGALTYNEPPDWHLPARQMLGHVLLEARRLDEAEAAFLADLETYPGNRWSQDGLQEARQRRP